MNRLKKYANQLYSKCGVCIKQNVIFFRENKKLDLAWSASCSIICTCVENKVYLYFTNKIFKVHSEALLKFRVGVVWLIRHSCYQYVLM